MNKQFNKKNFWNKLKTKYQFHIENKENIKVTSLFTTTMLNAIIGIGILFVLFLLLGLVTIAYTPLRNYVPGYGQYSEKRKILENQMKLDSLEMKASQNDRKLKIIEKVMTGDFDTTAYPENIFTIEYDSLDVFSGSKEDSLLRAGVEQRERFSIFDDEEIESYSLNDMSLFPPAKGTISDNVDVNQRHYGMDIIVGNNKDVKVVQDGTVIFSEFTVETGYIIGVQHPGELLSIYKHNSQLNKKVGEIVEQGDVIAKAGNTGELSNGPHLHFELWYRGEAVDPTKYINFE